MRHIVTPHIALAGIRIIALILLGSGAAEGGHFDKIEQMTLAIAAAWTIVTAAAVVVGQPRSLPWVQVIFVGDLLFAFGIALGGYILCTLALTGAAVVASLSFGGPRFTALLLASAPATAAMLMFVASQMGMVRTERSWPEMLLVVASCVLAALSVASYFLHRKQVQRLSRRFDLTSLMSMETPFAFHLDAWLALVAPLFGGQEESLCAIVLTNAEGLGQIHSSRPAGAGGEGDSAGILRFASRFGPTLAPVNRLAEGNDVAAVHAVQLFARQMHAKGDAEGLLARTIHTGRIRGLFVISHSLPSNDALNLTLGHIDRALDVLLDQLWDTLETRRRFLAEAREIARRDLHDGVLQTLAALRMRLSTMAQGITDQNEELGQDLRRTSEIVSLEQARLRSLLETGFDDSDPVNLIDSLKICLRTISLQWDIQAEMITDEIAIPTDRETAANIEHLVREIVANASRHSSSRKIALGVAMRSNALILTLRDYRNSEELGLPLSNPMDSRSLKQRLALVQGEAYWDDVAKGTLLAINIPMIEDSDA